MYLCSCVTMQELDGVRVVAASCCPPSTGEYVCMLKFYDPGHAAEDMTKTEGLILSPVFELFI